MEVEEKIICLGRRDTFSSLSLLGNVVVQKNVLDMWIQKLEKDKQYVVKGVYQSLTHALIYIHPSSLDIIWNKKAPLKLSLFGWIFSLNRLPTKDNLLREGVIIADSLVCVGR